MGNLTLSLRDDKGKVLDQWSLTIKSGRPVKLPQVVAGLDRAHLEDRADHSRVIWQLLTLETWLRLARERSVAAGVDSTSAGAAR